MFKNKRYLKIGDQRVGRIEWEKIGGFSLFRVLSIYYFNCILSIII